MRPLTSSGLKRRMNELERALSTTIVILGLIFLLTAAGWVEDNSLKKKIFLPPQNVIERPIYPTEDQRMILRAEIQQKPSKTNVAGSDLDETYFLPGTLNMNRTDVLHRCYVSSEMRLPQGQGCSISQKYRIIFHLTPKSGSSTGRHVIKADFNGEDRHSDQACMVQEDDPHKDDWIQVAVLRNPATRAFASYEEMFVRRLGKPEMIPKHARAFMEPFRDWIYKNYSALFDTVEGVRKLNDAYEQFMRDWNGDAFDMHLESQVAYNIRKRSHQKRHDASHLTFVFDTHSMEDSFKILSKMVNLGKIPKVIKGRAYPRRLNVSHVSDQAYQAMCRRYMHDFCCLNYRLPAQCLKDVPIGERVRCRWIQDGSESLIESVIV